MADSDVLIIGGGVIGCSLARALAAKGTRVVVVERSAPGREASWAAAGMLAPSAEAEKDSPIFALGRASLLAYRPMVEGLLEETGIDVQYRTEGTLLVYTNEAERQAMLPSMQWQRAQGIHVEELSAAELRIREPQLAPLPGGFFLADDHQVDNRLLMHALVSSARQLGVEFVLGNAVGEVTRNGTKVTGVRLADRSGTEFRARHVVNTAGAWAKDVAVTGLPAAPIRPVKGHMVALETAPGMLRHVIRGHSGYMVPRRDGRILVGSTMEESGFDKTPRAAQIDGLLRTAQALSPALENAFVSELWAGLRPAASDGVPILGPTDLDGYWLALGHFRNGILLAPITAQILSTWILFGKPSLPIEDALRPQRFR